MRIQRPKSIIFYIPLIITIVFIIIMLYGWVIFFIDFDSMRNFKGVASLISLIILSVIFTKAIFYLINKRIIVMEDKIYVREDIGNKDTKLQYLVDIRFEDIQSIGMIGDSKNSRNQYMRGNFTPMPNIVLFLNNDKKVRINVYYYSKKQTIEIIDYIIDRKRLDDPFFVNDSGQKLIDGLKKKRVVKKK